MPKISFISDNTTTSIEVQSGTDVLSAARLANVAIDAPCSGNGSCGKCRIRIAEGNVDSTETRHINKEDFDTGWRLACLSKVSEDITVEVPDIAAAYKSRMKVADLSSGKEVEIFTQCQNDIENAGLAFGNGAQVLKIKLEEPTLDDTMPDDERLSRAAAAELGASDVIIPYSVLKTLPGKLRDAQFDLSLTVQKYEDRAEILRVAPASDAAPACGLAIDIGTTSVTGILADLESGKILAKASSGNGQIRYGADVIHRIVEQEKPGGIKILQDAVIKETLIPLILAMEKEAKVPADAVISLTIAGNSTMNHLFLGIDAGPLRREPYIPAFFSCDPVPAGELGLPVNPKAPVHIMPNIGSYVGGDITAGTLASMVWDKDEINLFIDLGTNGELVLGNRDFLMSCACSAGPAFEGGDISCGMRATDGAAEACTIDKDTMEPSLSIIGGGALIGLCGSGLIDVISELFRCGIINAKGKFVREGERVKHNEHGMGRYVLAVRDDGREVSISETDIDNFIRAKGSIFSAIMTMLQSLDMDVSVIDSVYVAGGIGSGIDMDNAVRIGMLPDIERERFHYIGNSSLAGAYAGLTSTAAREKINELAQSMTYLELSAIPGYMDSFVAACFLPHTDASLFPSVKQN
ncbi:MAG: DUF4445 domain-containing protein [Firmicutes bacterium]|nr:DUF4445 domain-containing protein [Bacillota bacterium]